MLTLPKYSMGIGDRFGRQGEAQLRTLIQARDDGIEIAPVWNKSHREHTIIGTTHGDVRREADAAVAALGWEGPYFVDADHINLGTVDAYLDASDYFTIDVADFNGVAADPEALEAFVERHAHRAGTLSLPDNETALSFDVAHIRATAGKYLRAVQEAGRIYRHIAGAKGAGTFVTEVSVDETDSPQTPTELYLILAAMAEEGIPAQTLAPRFSGRFNKGVDYVGDLERFKQEFDADLAVLRLAVDEFGLPGNLKLSVHSGSDKFALYGPIGAAIRRRDAGLHLKTAGTTWLEEMIGLAAAGGEGLALARQIYGEALARLDELTSPYRTVIDIDPAQLPSAATVNRWDSDAFTGALRHEIGHPAYNRHLRQLLHVGYKIAVELGERFRQAQARHADVMAANVTENLYARHISRIFMSQ